MSSSSSGPMFALVIPGRPLTTNFQAVDAKKMVTVIPNPAQISEFTVCLLAPNIPQDAGIAVYYSLPPFNEWQYVGAVTLQYPTAPFRAPWRNKIPPETAAVQLGLSVESAAFFSDKQPADQKEEERSMDSAKGIAQDLYNFMGSYSQKTGQYANLGNVLVIPTNCIDKWFEKFQAKHRVDPYFWLKKA